MFQEFCSNALRCEATLPQGSYLIPSILQKCAAGHQHFRGTSHILQILEVQDAFVKGDTPLWRGAIWSIRRTDPAGLEHFILKGENTNGGPSLVDAVPFLKDPDPNPTLTELTEVEYNDGFSVIQD